jgi:hypothetical protein
VFSPPQKSSAAGKPFKPADWPFLLTDAIIPVSQQKSHRQEKTMRVPRALILLSLIMLLLLLAACQEKSPNVEWQLTIDGDVKQSVTYTFQDLTERRRTEFNDILTRNPDDPDEKTSWQGITLFALLQKPGGVEYTLDWSVRITLADGTSERTELPSLRGAFIALKNGEGNWLADTYSVPVRLIIPNRPSTDWLDGPVRITIDGPEPTPTPPSQ